MTDYNKETLAQTIVYIVVGLVAFFSIIAFVFLVKAGAWWSVPIPLAAALVMVDGISPLDSTAPPAPPIAAHSNVFLSARILFCLVSSFSYASMKSIP